MYMGTWKRAYLYVTRKRMRSMLLFLIFLTAGLFLFIGISIRRSAGEAAEDFQKTLKTGLRVEGMIVDAAAAMDITDNEKGEKVIRYKIPFMMEEHIEEFLAIDGVSGFYCESMERMNGYTGLSLHPGYYAWCMDIISGKIPVEGEITKEFRDYLVNEIGRAHV